MKKEREFLISPPFFFPLSRGASETKEEKAAIALRREKPSFPLPSQDYRRRSSGPSGTL